MEIEVGVEGEIESKCQHSVLGDESPSQNSPEQISDPVVYKLVRVQGDGRLVPATDDELVVVEDLLKVDKSEVKGSEKKGGESLNDEPSSGGLLVQGSLQLERIKGDETHQNFGLEEKLLPSPTLFESKKDQCGNDEACSKQAKKDEELPSASTYSGTKPNFSLLNGEICLDDLSIRELHETFKATFGRETTVKDKQWLKRRISMGLSNSCDVSIMSFILKNDKLERKEKSDSPMDVDSASPVLSEIGRVNDSHKHLSSNHNRKLECHQNVSGTKTECPGVQIDCTLDEFQGEDRAAKRARKPTKRYIEELSEVDSGDADGRLISPTKKLIAPTKKPGQIQAYPKSTVATVRNLSSHDRTLVTRLDSLGGSGVRIPYVSRVRRSRPRKDITSLMKLVPSSMDMEAHLVKKVLAVSDYHIDYVSGDDVLKAEAGNKYQQSSIGQEKDKQWPGTGRIKQDQNLIGDTSDDNGDTLPTAKGGIKRKHHRAWSLSEVMKLVEGVSRYGAGRWSEIKRVAFASDTYRTAVDLKDKWRNLLRASFTQAPQDKGLSSRKHAPAPIPAAILVRVRELAEMHAQAPPILTSSKIASCGGTNVNEIKSGFL